MKSKLIGTLLLAGSSLFTGHAFAGTRVSVGLSFGAPVVPVAPAATFVEYRPAYPGRGYVWVDGYYDYYRGRRVWHAGYWRAPVIERRYDRRFVERRYDDRFDRRYDNRYHH